METALAANQTASFIDAHDKRFSQAYKPWQRATINLPLKREA